MSNDDSSVQVPSYFFQSDATSLLLGERYGQELLAVKGRDCFPDPEYAGQPKPSWWGIDHWPPMKCDELVSFIQSKGQENCHPDERYTNMPKPYWWNYPYNWPPSICRELAHLDTSSTTLMLMRLGSNQEVETATPMTSMSLLLAGCVAAVVAVAAIVRARKLASRQVEENDVYLGEPLML
ncbi:Aste57867_9431 [Aphanomyces stellatus]|uniref:Aste57867_9431 protein n=1 Tax=Aphanomyces stellatus TaxID=120398 RepID=A0A485KN66_9STRA|nr:hypothetical protein As57867_009395 [Aphanomyces stellatus]VFT86311.1 Aste57867_9431 [Aphanomyces stellatus]